MKTAFTMIELIFVIVILGVLASVALPKFKQTAQQAHEAKLISFVKTLNRTTGPDLWSKSISEGHHGDISYIHSIKNKINIPQEINGSDIDLSNCNSDSDYKEIAESNSTVIPVKYIIECKDGTSTDSPYFRLRRTTDNKIIAKRN